MIYFQLFELLLLIVKLGVHLRYWGEEKQQVVPVYLQLQFSQYWLESRISLNLSFLSILPGQFIVFLIFSRAAQEQDPQNTHVLSHFLYPRLCEKQDRPRAVRSVSLSVFHFCSSMSIKVDGAFFLRNIIFNICTQTSLKTEHQLCTFPRKDKKD